MPPAELRVAIQQDDNEARAQGRPQSQASRIDFNSANMAERRQRCTSIPPGSCACPNRQGCEYCRMRDIIATGNIQNGGTQMTSEEIETAIQHDVSGRFDQLDQISANMMERLGRCTSDPRGSCAEEGVETPHHGNRNRCDYCRMHERITTRRNRVPMPPSEQLAIIQRDDYERLWRSNREAINTAMQSVTLEGETQTLYKGTCEDCLHGGCCVGAAGGGPCTFVGTCNSCIRFRTCAGAANGGPCSRVDRTTPTQGPDTSSQESVTRSEREEIASLALTQDAKAEARVAELVEETTTSNLDQDDVLRFQ